eukprot:Protomagalhaensia_wolfi_Nauph_80__2215@NODE_2436_length_1092_cov_4_949668_g1908_i0_p1_GENE_NODE_2436_length_1092_cov_4_949668_g1908_i0NODE_2436_length_1092_cov_4_949668_g1908_i0_p1_ORF_typecomplete_len255_score51_17Cullin_binding/PF03556_15/6_8e28UBA_4/PF14555_6/2e09UBA_4/PF14555_6/2_3e03_NODE_2436_length_1092_cov_4_949668_g1908_i03081072
MQTAIRKFLETTLTDDKTARKFLRRHEWDVGKAIDDYFSSGGSLRTTVVDTFIQLADPTNKRPDIEVLDGEGVNRFCSVLDIEPVDPRILVFCHACEASTMGAFTRAEFIRGFSALKVHNMDELKSQLSEWTTKLTVPESIRPIYRFLFKYALEDNSKSLPLEAAKEYWALLLGPLKFELYSEWMAFVDEVLAAKESPHISRDTWNVVFDFMKDTPRDAIAKYDVNESAWPSIIDDFVEWEKSRQSDADCMQSE